MNHLALQESPAKTINFLPAGEDDRTLDREQSWLQFNQRVLQMAVSSRTPALERLAFLAIYSSNLDEYFMKRVGLLVKQSAELQNTFSHHSVDKQLTDIRTHVLELQDARHQAWIDTKAQLMKEDVCLVNWEDLSAEEQQRGSDIFHNDLFALLTPLAVDSGHPFPFISNLSTSLAVVMKPQDTLPGLFPEDEKSVIFARVKVPTSLPQWIRIDDGKGKEIRMISLEEIIRAHMELLFVGHSILDTIPFRITRNAALDGDEEDADNLLHFISQELRQRKFAEAVRLEIDCDIDHPLTQFLIQELHLRAEDVYPACEMIDPTSFWGIYSAIDRPDLKFKSWKPITPRQLIDTETGIFDQIRREDILVHHPYESFAGSVQRFIYEAAHDPDVVTLKLTLYRTSDSSPFIRDLIFAAEAGKQVVVLVEIKARFDEERNVQLAKKLEKHGIHVVYGIIGLKTHTKISLVVRREQDGYRSYAHIGTGNYNPKTAGLYTDLGLMTADKGLTREVATLFHNITGHTQSKDFKKLMIAPLNMRTRFLEMIDNEIQSAESWQKNGAVPEDPKRPGIIAKMNQLQDPLIIEALYKASQAGVPIQLIVRGFCCLRPGVEGLSENITVTSIIGRFLEHSRIFKFNNHGEPTYHIGSADWMYRNLDGRIECIAPVNHLKHQKTLEAILQASLQDTRQAWRLQPDGHYVQRVSTDEQNIGEGTHNRLIRYYKS